MCCTQQKLACTPGCSGTFGDFNSGGLAARTPLMFFDTWYDMLPIAVVGAISYAGLVFFLQTSGKRTLSKMNAFDLVVTIALGSTFASAILSREIALVEALLAFALLCGLQYGVASLTVRAVPADD